MKTHTMLKLALAAIGAAGLSSCSMKAEGGGLAAYQAYDRPAKMPRDRSAVKVKVSLSKQRAYVMEGGEMLMAMPVSIGAPESATPTGNFRISEKKHKYRASNHGYAFRGTQVKKTLIGSKPSGWSFKGTPLPYWCGFKADYGFHTGWVRHSPCTNGCIRMHENLSPKFFAMVSIGTPVDISYRQAEDARWAYIPLPPDAGPLPDHPSSMYTGDGYFTRHKAPEFD